MNLNKASENIEKFNCTVISDLDKDIKKLKKSSVSDQYDKELTKRISK